MSTLRLIPGLEPRPRPVAEVPAEQPEASAEAQPQKGRLALPGGGHDAARLKGRKLSVLND